MLKVHQRWKAVTEILQACKECQASQSLPLSSENKVLERLTRQATESVLSTEVTVSKDDAEALNRDDRSVWSGISVQQVSNVPQPKL